MNGNRVSSTSRESKSDFLILDCSKKFLESETVHPQIQNLGLKGSFLILGQVRSKIEILRRKLQLSAKLDLFAPVSFFLSTLLLYID